MLEHRPLSEVALESETAVAGSILIDPRCLDDVRRHVTADTFLFENCREVFSVACQLADNGETIDPVRILDRSKTFPGIAKAMAEQWAGSVKEVDSNASDK